MKIKEAQNIVNKATYTVRTMRTDEAIYFYEETVFNVDKYFLRFKNNIKDWDEVETQYDCLYCVSSEDLAFVFKVIQRLLDTPVDERVGTKLYRVKFNRELLLGDQYVESVFNDIDKFGFKLTSDKEEAVTFAKSELDSFPFTLKFETEEADE